MNKQMKKAASLLIAAGLITSASLQTFAHWGDGAIDYSVSHGYISAQAVNPDDTAKRYELAAAMYALEGKPETTQTVEFEDVEAGADYAKAIAWAVAEGIVAGVEDTKFDPQGGVTREMLAEILFRYGQAKELTTDGGMAVREFADYDKIADWAIGGTAYCVSTGLMVGDDEGNFKPQQEMTYAEFATVIQKFAEKLERIGEAGQTAPVASIKMYMGEVMDGTMNGVAVVTAEGEERRFNTENAKTVSLGEDGIAVGDFVKITYIENGETDTALCVEEIDKADVNFVAGTVEDMSMNVLQIKTEDGASRTFITTYAEISGGTEGIAVGDTVTVTYAGKLERDVAAKVVKVEEDAENSEDTGKAEGEKTGQDNAQKDKQSDGQAEKEKLTLEIVKELAKKGEALSWKDFALYESVETGSGLYILIYEIDENYNLMIGGPSMDEDPIYIRLVKADDVDAYIDIRTEDIEKFLTK